jgi:rhomboid protease GluP
VAGGVFGAALSWVAGIPLTEGASGGIFALLGAAFTFAFRHGGDLPAALMASLRRRLALWIAFNLGVGLLLPFVNNVAHGGGLVVGLILGMAMDSAAATGQPPDRRVSAALVGLMLLLAGWGLWGISTKW